MSERPFIDIERADVQERKILRGIIFERIPKPGNATLFKNSELGRKVLILEDTEFEPEDNKSYDVEIVRDTDPSNPEKGKLIGRILEAPMKEKKKFSNLPIEVDVDGGRVVVLDSLLTMNPHGGELVPPEENYRYFTLDQRTLETIDKIATAVELGEPCLLEGETSTSKTSSIEYLASRGNYEVVRLNLNGQTDTSELVGKFIPNDGQLQIAFEEALMRPDILGDQSKEIIRTAQAEGRSLTLVESQKIAAAENLTIPEWRWQDGIIPAAMKKGQWVILDEINLAEAQILERLNPVLEKNPSITLSENGGVKIGPGGKFPVHKSFRIFGTMNPAEYAGRAPMSPAYKDRWTSYKFVSPPTETDYRAMLNLMVFGEQPAVNMRGKQYDGEKIEPMFDVLGQVPKIREFLAKIARFQITLENMSRIRDIGKSKKEKYIFTRRGLIEFLGYLEKKTVFDRKTNKSASIKTDPKQIVLRAIQYYYLDKISDPDDARKVRDQLSAIGISESNWTHSFV